MKIIPAFLKKTLPLLVCAIMVMQPAVSRPAYADLEPTLPSDFQTPPDGFQLPGDTPAVGDITDIDACTQNSPFTEEQITSRVVFCIRAAVMTAVSVMLSDLSEYMTSTVSIGAALAICIFGIRVMGGEAEVNAKAMGILLRLALVWMFSYNLGNLGNWLFDIMDWLISLVVPSGWTPWEQIDAFLGRLLGFAPGLTLANGVAGVAFAAALSATSGTSMFGAFLIAMWDLMMFILDIVYAYLTAMLVLGFMIILSPLIIPLAMFNYTERFFKKWLNTVIGALIMPMMLFGFLSFSLDVFDTLIQNVISKLSDDLQDSEGNPTFQQHWRINQPLMSWVTSADPNQILDLQKQVSDKAKTREEEKVYPPIATEINPFERVGMDQNPADMIGADYSTDQMRDVLYGFLALWIYARLIMGLVRKMPEIAAAIAASAFLALRPQSFREKVQQAKKDIAFGAGAMAGGWGGSQVGGLAGSRGRSAGAVAGMLVGGTMAENYSDKMGDKFGDALSKQINSAGSALNEQAKKLIGRR